MGLSLKETRAISGLAEVLYDFLPGSGHTAWKGHVNFRTVAAKVGVGDLWPGGSKRPAIVFLLTHTFERERSTFQRLIEEIVRAGINYREKQGNPIAAAEIDQVNGHILELGFKFPELWDRDFRSSLRQSTAERAREQVRQADFQEQKESAALLRSKALAELKERFLELEAMADRKAAGIALEKLLNRLFEVFGMSPRLPFRVTGEQIDGSFEFEGDIYLIEAKWEKRAMKEADLLVFKGKIEAKSPFTRGVFIAVHDVTEEARKAITQGKVNPFFVMNGHDLMMILCEAITLPAFLKKRIRILAEEGRMCVPYAEIA